MSDFFQRQKKEELIAYEFTLRCFFQWTFPGMKREIALGDTYHIYFLQASSPLGVLIQMTNHLNKIQDADDVEEESKSKEDVLGFDP